MARRGSQKALTTMRPICAPPRAASAHGHRFLRSHAEYIGEPIFVFERGDKGGTPYSIAKALRIDRHTAAKDASWAGR